VIGVGRIGLFHARTLLELEDVAAVTVADADPARAAAVASELGTAIATMDELVDGAEASVGESPVAVADRPDHGGAGGVAGPRRRRGDGPCWSARPWRLLG
jgi:myo-inositol 2-dehydrogenase / D-chiro-inositol 1-dehydrogenase